MTEGKSVALPVAYVALRVLIFANLLLGGGIVALLLVLPHQHWIMTSLRLAPSPEALRVVWGLRAVATLGLAAVPINHLILGRLVGIVEATRRGDAFTDRNARRLQRIAWLMLVLQLLGILIGSIGRMVSTPAHPVRLDAGFSPAGWLAVLLTFVLARIFAEGTRMREDLEGTV